MKKFFTENKSNPWFWAFFIGIIVIFLAMPIMSKDAGNSGDEDGFQWPYAKQVQQFYATSGKDTSCLKNDDMGMHGGFFDPLTVIVVKTFNIDDYAQARHAMNAIFGAIGILFASLLAKKCKGWRAGVITMILLFLSPRFLGHSFNNPKDLIFASMFMMGIYYVYCFITEYPKPTIKTSIMLAISSALAIVSRFAGILLFAYLGLFFIIYYFAYNKKGTYWIKDNMKIVGRYLLYTLAIVLVSFGLTVAMWPYIMHTPLATLHKVILGMSNYSGALRQLFEGNLTWSDALPWYYTPKYILMTIPVAVIIGLLVFMSICWRKRAERFGTFFVLFMFLFPIFWIVYTHANIYGGWRHIMFCYPPMVVASGLGFNSLIELIENKYGKITVIDVIAMVSILLLLWNPIRHIIKNHPYEYVYFNELEGGIKNAFAKYEMDYYYNSTREASEWVISNAKMNGLEIGKKIKVATWHTASVNYFFRNDTAKFQVDFTRYYERGNSDWDYAIFTVTGIDPAYLKSKAFPPKNTVKTIDVDGVPIAIILKRTDKSDYYAFKLKNENKLDSALALYKKAIAIDPYNDCAYVNMGELYIRKKMPDSALYITNKFLAFQPNSENTEYLQAYAYYMKGNANEALRILHKIHKENIKYLNAYYLAIQIYVSQKDIASADKEFMKIIDSDQVNDQVAAYWIQYNAFQGINQQDALIDLYHKMIRSQEKRGKKREAKDYQKQLDNIMHSSM